MKCEMSVLCLVQFALSNFVSDHEVGFQIASLPYEHDSKIKEFKSL